MELLIIDYVNGYVYKKLLSVYYQNLLSHSKPINLENRKERYAAIQYHVNCQKSAIKP